MFCTSTQNTFSVTMVFPMKKLTSTYHASDEGVDQDTKNYGDGRLHLRFMFIRRPNRYSPARIQFMIRIGTDLIRFTYLCTIGVRVHTSSHIIIQSNEAYTGIMNINSGYEKRRTLIARVQFVIFLFAFNTSLDSNPETGQHDTYLIKATTAMAMSSVCARKLYRRVYSAMKY